MEPFKNLKILNHEAIQEGRDSIYGTIPLERSIKEYINTGLIILDKHSGPTSHEIVSIVKKILSIPKAGHSGTLDPNVTGVLPIALVRATKILPTLLTSRKTYICNLQSSKSLSKEDWEPIFEEYQDEIYQVPPLKSNVAKKLRKRRIYDLDILDVREKEVLFKAECQSGTYIRTLCIDIGKSIGLFSFMKELRRIQTGPFREDQAITLHQLFDAYETYQETEIEDSLREIILPMEKAIVNLPKVVLNINAIDPVAHGTDLFSPGIIAHSDFKSGEMIALLGPKGDLLAIGNSYRSSENLSIDSKGKVIHPIKIIVGRGVYPKYTK